MPDSRATHSHLLGALLAGFFVVAFCFILLAHDPLVFWNDDYQLSILPVFADVARSWSEGHLPLLSPYSWVCGNLAGEYQYGTFSIFVNAAVVLIWKFPLTFSQQAAALSITHLFALAIGAFLLARQRNFDIPLSIFVSLVATLNGWIICWGASDWFGALAAFTWLPWCWWAFEKSTLNAQRSTPNIQLSSVLSVERWTLSVGRFLRGALLPAPFVYLLVTGGFPYTVLMLALLVVWLAIKSLVETKTSMSILPMLAGVALGFSMSAPAWLALLDYTSGSARAVTTANAHWQWLVPWRALPGFIIPAWTVSWTDFSNRMTPHRASELACGLAAPIALIAALLNRGRAFLREMKWDFALLIAVLLLCMLPSAGVFRWSFRWLPLLHVVLALCAARAMQDRQRPALIGLLAVGIVAVTMSILHRSGTYAFPLTWILLALTALWFVLESRIRSAWLFPSVTFASLLATYLCVPPNCGVPKYNLAQELTKPAPLDPQRLYLSVYPMAELTYRVETKPQPVGQVVRPGSTSMWGSLRFVNGYSPILAAGIARELRFAIHGEFDIDYGEYIVRDQSGALAELGIDGIIIANQIAFNPEPWEWEPVFANDEGRVFHRRGGPLPTVRSVHWIDSRPHEEFAIARLANIHDTRNRVEVDVDLAGENKPALLKFTRPYFGGYVASLGATRLKVDSYRGLLPLVEVPAGAHGRVVLAYRPAWLIYGGALSILSMSILLVGAIAAQYTSRL